MSVRIDKFLWCVRLFKTRGDAAEAVKNGRVMMNGSQVKASRDVSVGDTLSVRRAPVVYSYKIVELVRNRQPARNVVNYIIDTTPGSELAKLEMMRLESFGQRDRGAGRPTKRDRRDLEGFLGDDFEGDEVDLDATGIDVDEVEALYADLED